MEKTKPVYVSIWTLILIYGSFTALILFGIYQWNKQLGLEAVL